MENLLSLLGMLFFAFLLLAAAVETVLEVFRGLASAVGLPLLRPNISLEDVLAQADEFAPPSTVLRARAEAMVFAAEQLRSKLQSKLKNLETVRESLRAAGESFDQPAQVLTRLAADIRAELERRERIRIIFLRLLAAGVGCLLVWMTDFYVLKMLGSAPEAAPFVRDMQNLEAPWLNILLGGLGAAAGSSYWHDQLDKIRNLKSAVAGLKAVVEPIKPPKAPVPV